MIRLVHGELLFYYNDIQCNTGVGTNQSVYAAFRARFYPSNLIDSEYDGVYEFRYSNNQSSKVYPLSSRVAGITEQFCKNMLPIRKIRVYYWAAAFGEGSKITLYGR